MSLFEAQLTILLLTLIGTFACGILPIVFFRCLNCISVRSNNKITSFLIYFGGGVLFATSLLHLLPEARKQLEDFSHTSEKGHVFNTTDVRNPQNEHLNDHVTFHNESENKHRHHSPHGHEHNFAYPEFILLCGFFGTYLIEELIRTILKRRSNGNLNGDQIKFCSCAQRNTECSRTYKDLRLEKGDLLTEDYLKRKRSSTWAGQENKEDGSRNFLPGPGPPPDLLRSSIFSQPKYGATDEVETTGLPMRLDGGITLINRPVAALPAITVPEIIVTPAVSESLSNHKISIGSLLTVAALSFHSIFEGIAMGFQSSITNTWTLFFAVALHKFVIAFVIGVETVIEKNTAAFVLACMAVFSSMSPLGMIIAMSLGGSNSDSVSHISHATVGYVNCIAGGTLLYVTFIEILRRKCENFCGLQRLAATAVGFLLMSATQYITAEM